MCLGVELQYWVMCVCALLCDSKHSQRRSSVRGIQPQALCVLSGDPVNKDKEQRAVMFHISDHISFGLLKRFVSLRFLSLFSTPMQ